MALLFGAQAALGASVVVDNEPVILGRTESVGMTIKVNELPGTEARPLRLSVNVGSFGTIERLGPGTYRTLYTPPSTRFPQVALVAVWRETGPDAPIDFLRVPLYGMSQLKVSARAGSEVKVEIGPAQFGPVTIRANGAAVVPVVVPPGVPEAVISVTEKSGKVTRRRAKVDVPPYNRMTMAVVPHALLANGKDPARIEVFCDLGETKLPNDQLKLDASVGQAVFETSAKGRYVFRYVAPKGSTEHVVKFDASVQGDPITHSAIELELGLPPPTTLVLTAPEKSIQANGHAQATIAVEVFDATGLGLPQQQLELTANGVVLPLLVYKGDGRYEAAYVAPATYPTGGLVQLHARVIREGKPLAASANYQLLPPAVPSSVTSELRPKTVVADGKSKGRVTLDVRDSAGLPLKGAQLILLADKGAISPLVEVGEGLYQADYSAPPEAATSEATLKLIDASGTFERQVQIPLRAGAGVLLGARAGYTHSLGPVAGPRAGVDVWVPIRMGDWVIGLGLSATWGQAQQTVVDSGGLFATRSQANIVPMIARAGYELVASPRFSVHVGAGAQVTWVEVRSSVQKTAATAVRVGGLGFLNAAMTLGPGQLFVEVAYAFAPVDHPDFRLNAGGASFEGGYRLSLF